MRGRAIPLSIHRRMVIDLLYFARGIPTVPVQKRMSLAPLVAARAACRERPRWTVIFTKAYSLLAQEFPELRRAYVKIPWPHLYEYPVSKATIIVRARLPWRAGCVVILDKGTRTPIIAGYRTSAAAGRDGADRTN